MSNPTSNFGWQMPTPTDLVTDLPADFEVFGQAVDTSMADLKGGTTGQILSKNTNADMDFVWITNDQGDITAVNVTSPITGGGTSGAVTVGIQSASTTQSGAVQLSDSTSTTSSVLASTPTATKAAYDLANTANTTANAAIPKSTVTTNGDLIYGTGSGTVSRIGVGSSGQVLTVSGGVPAWATPSSGGSNTFYAGKNRVINGDFFINQRAFTSNTTSGTYNFDRWQQLFSGGSQTITPQTFTAGTAPVSGYEGKTYSQIVTASQSAAGDYSAYVQRIESVRTFAGQTVTVSLWAKASTGTPKIGVNLLQSFGNGGSPSADVIVAAATPTATISSSWARYSFVFNVPSISGKTIGTQNTDALRLDIWTSVGTSISGAGYPAVGLQNVTIGVWGVQIEAGSTATDFVTASGNSYQGELAMCQRYYYKVGANGISGCSLGAVGAWYSSTRAQVSTNNPVVMRTTPSVSISGAAIYQANGSRASVTAFQNNGYSTTSLNIDVTSTGGVAGNGTILVEFNTGNGYLEASAEL